MIRGGGDFLLKVTARDKDHRDEMTMKITSVLDAGNDHTSTGRVSTLETIRTSKDMPGVTIDLIPSVVTGFNGIRKNNRGNKRASKHRALIMEPLSGGFYKGWERWRAWERSRSR